MLKKLFLLLLIFHFVYAEDILVITNLESDISTLKKDELRKIYLKKRRLWKETKLFPLNLPPDSIYRKVFEQKILKMPSEALDIYWMKQHYHGHRPPYMLKSVKSIILFVKKVKGAIGYIPQSSADGSVKTIYKLSI